MSLFGAPGEVPNEGQDLPAFKLTQNLPFNRSYTSNI
jgi:hypothetical protein